MVVSCGWLESFEDFVEWVRHGKHRPAAPEAPVHTDTNAAYIKIVKSSVLCRLKATDGTIYGLDDIWTLALA